MGERTGIVIVRSRICRNVGRIQGILPIFSVTKDSLEESNLPDLSEYSFR